MRDFDRKLDESGVEEAIGMGRLMAKHQLVPDIVICSTAVRAAEGPACNSVFLLLLLA